ncbi:LPS export ABC transporter periplasmic protein LptC [Candidatus Marithrix sp. Canyon 246]|uniref:LPS export ABC transporter periplasmic protein LptC n=1 Tax=Candidatus Marithrix sp. Canyon 246 TaxID=1827136 RepID=UPI00084A01AD|nr:LPS export ABC transporter periplasmic protein LptC [Candidatus Marithrix sp. Canyon 246]
MINNWAGWLVLIVFAMASTWLMYSLEQDFSVNPTINPNLSDYTLKNFTSVQLNEQGRLKNKLLAETMTHYPTINTKLTKPYLIFYKQDKPTWTVRSQRGEISPNNNEVWLLGNANLHKLHPNPTKQLKIISKDLWVILNKEYAETAKASTIISNTTTTHSVGMQVFMPIEKIHLLSKVRGYYVTP